MTVKVYPFGGKLPRYAHINDAGADVFAALSEPYELRPHETFAVPLGVGVEIPVGYVGFVFPRSGLSRRGIVAQLPPIDPGYTGEIHGVMTNFSEDAYVIQPDDRIGQLVVLPVLAPEYSLMLENDRGDAVFGSSGR